MNKPKIVLIIFYLIFFCTAAFCQQLTDDIIAGESDDEQLAAQYYQNKEFEKAAILYNKLYSKNSNPVYYNNFLNCLLELRNFSDAEKLVRRRIKKENYGLKNRVDLGYVYQRAGEPEKAAREFENLLKELKGEIGETSQVANAFIMRRYFDYAVRVYENSRKLSGEKNIFNIELADIFERTGKYVEMTEEYLNLLESNRQMLGQMQNRLQIVLSNDPENKKNEVFKKTLLKRIQQNPNNTMFAELMLWHAIQLKDFESALKQAKSLDRLFKENGDRVYSIATLAVSNKEYNVAEDALEYIIGKGRNLPFYVNSRIDLLNVNYMRLSTSLTYTTQEIELLEKKFIDALDEFGKNSATIPLIQNLAGIQAYYLDKYESASALLNGAMQMSQISREDRAKCKTLLGDVLLISGEVWEATLLYSQVEKEFKYDTIGFNAKLKNARLFYYIGEFRWANAQLDILKAATSKLIANDAMNLYLLINDNTDLSDSTGASDEPLKLFAKADLFYLRNKMDAALELIDTILIRFPEQTICDRAYYKKAEIMIRKGLYQEADTLLGSLITKYFYSVVADDAILRKAEINQYQLRNTARAMELYEKLFMDFPSSIYAVEARKRFRQLRGDQIN